MQGRRGGDLKALKVGSPSGVLCLREGRRRRGAKVLVGMGMKVVRDMLRAGLEGLEFGIEGADV